MLYEAAKNTLIKNGTKWSLGKKLLTDLEVMKLLQDRMKGKPLFVIPYKEGSRLVIKVCDSPVVALANMGLIPDGVFNGFSESHSMQDVQVTISVKNIADDTGPTSTG